MKTHHAKFSFAILWALTCLAPQSLFAQSYPAKPIRLIVPFVAGGPTDVVARIVAQNLAPILQESVVVENKPGASGFIGTEAVARAQPDGYTLLLITASTHAISPNLFKKLPYDPIKDFAMVGQFTDASLILVVTSSLPVASVAELVKLLKSKPGKMNYASWGSGGAAHMAGELFKQATETDMMHIPYKGSAPAITDLMGGQVSVFFDTITSSLPHARSGKLKGLAVTGPKRTAAAPEIPTVAETYPGFEVTVWQGVGAPAQTPRPIVNKLNAAMCKMVAIPAVKEKFLGLGADPVCNTPEQFTKHIEREINKWAGVVKRAKIPMEG
ncbi:MAG: tripartite tricarboxylate transporter substrate binding protein [Betaproteobacteria bacterium]|nr:tripartite tricarboxylate transporter substrate binding protein [Betaproteobacteria bacterium]MBI2961953.1 tripartite tricarboxylate transporter substrate binding protein [Betaproteobacteria bacterium]